MTASALTVAEINDITVKISTEQTNDSITPIQVSASGSQTPYMYSLFSTPATGAGLTVDSSSGKITGTPTKAGTFTLTVKVTDKVKKTATESFSMAVSLIGDFNGDGVVNLSDHSLFVAAYGFSGGEDCWLQFRAFFVSLLSSDTEVYQGILGDLLFCKSFYYN